MGLLQNRSSPRLRPPPSLSASPASRAAPAFSQLPFLALLFALSLQEFFITYPLSFFLCYLSESWEKTLRLRKIEGRRRRGGQRMKWSDGITDSMDMS